MSRNDPTAPPTEIDGVVLADLGTDQELWARAIARALPGKIASGPGSLLLEWVGAAIRAGGAAGYCAGRRAEARVGTPR